MWKHPSKTVVAGAVGLALLVACVATAEDPSPAEAAYADIEQTLGFVPTFLTLFPESSIAGAWEALKSLQLNSETHLDGKTKELIGVAVAAQIPCQYCTYAHTAAARSNGATEEEIREAVAMAALTRHWSTVLNGNDADLETFKSDFDRILASADADE